MTPRHPTLPGRPGPPGATLDAEGALFCLPCRRAASLELLLYESATSERPYQAILLDPEVNRTGSVWHVHVEGLRPGACYTYRVDGPEDPAGTGLLRNRRKELCDPWAIAVTDDRYDRTRASDPRDAGHVTPRAMVVRDDYDWEGDRPLGRPLADSVIYEVHVGGFTRHPSAGVARPGTFAGLVEKIPHLLDLGITDVELLPVAAFDAQDAPPQVLARGNRNYWGYSPYGFFSPHPGYCATPREGTHRRELRDMVKALHRAGIGVILDVVWNHSAEGPADGPWIHLRGLANDAFYLLDPADRRRYLDYSGCGNTIHANHPVATDFIVGCLEAWVRDMHVDGFRFDLASALVRGEGGTPLVAPPLIHRIEASPILLGTHLIAEAWDAAGLYQVGAFPCERFAEWNGRYRDAIRRLLRGDPGIAGEVASRVAGSSDLYERSGRGPGASVNFVTCHDGFTLADLVTFERKRNEENGDENRDGTDENLGWSCGVEGESDDPEIKALRARQARNHAAILLLSVGVPMLLAGDEALRTQGGNNNAYCQDNATSWLDWGLAERNRDMLRFTRGLIALRKRHRSLRRTRFLEGKVPAGGRLLDVTWHGTALAMPPWDDALARLLAWTLAAVDPDEADLHVICNAGDEPLAFELPEVEGRRWRRAVDTSLGPPEDLREPGEQPLVPPASYEAGPRSVVVLEGWPEAYETRLDPPPAEARVAHPAKVLGAGSRSTGSGGWSRGQSRRVSHEGL